MIRFFSKEQIDAVHEEWRTLIHNSVCPPQWGSWFADKINSHLSELQAGNRERIEKTLLGLCIGGKKYPPTSESSAIYTNEFSGSVKEIADAVLSVIIPGSSEEVERLKAELADLRASMPKFKPGDVVYYLTGECIHQNVIAAIGEYSVWVKYKNSEVCVDFAHVGHTEAECRASIPVEHLKVEQ